MNALLPVEDALARLLALGRPVESEDCAVSQAHGRWLAADIAALRSQPETDLSAMDGYALRFADLPGPWRLVGESAAGAPYHGALASGEAVRIFTGAALPAGADTILVQEEASREDDMLHLSGDGPPCPAAHVRRASEDFRVGDTVIAVGERLTAARIGLAIAAGHARMPVSRRVRVAIISTGDELKPAGEKLGPGEIPASNGPMIAAQLSILPTVIHDAGIVGDDLDALTRAIEAAASADVVVTIGGASVGERDLVRSAFENAGGVLDFWRIAMKPGKPLMAGKLGRSVILGLPGNPVSAFVTSSLFLHPLIACLAGAAEPDVCFTEARLGTALPDGGTRHEFLRGRWESGRAVPIAGQGSAAVAALAETELLISRPPHAPPAGKGDPVDILMV